MQTITTVGLDIAKFVFQVHCVDANGDVVIGPGETCLTGASRCERRVGWAKKASSSAGGTDGPSPRPSAGAPGGT
jgi:hypothetical protein